MNGELSMFAWETIHRGLFRYEHTTNSNSIYQASYNENVFAVCLIIPTREPLIHSRALYSLTWNVMEESIYSYIRVDIGFALFWGEQMAR